MHEVIAIAEADGCNIQASVIEQQIASTEAMVPYDSSMRIDYKQGRPLEIETIITRPLETAIKHRVASPRLAELHRDLLAISDKPR
jgi:2-dehydropantoate 2-reductase